MRRGADDSAFFVGLVEGMLKGVIVTGAFLFTDRTSGLSIAGSVSQIRNPGRSVRLMLAAVRRFG